MKAVVREVYGGPDVLRIEDMPDPTVADDGVLVRVRATSINDWDWHLLTGRPVINRVGAMRRPKDRVLGSDVAGVVEQVGAGVTALQPGDRVYGDVSSHGFGAFAELVSAPATAFTRTPTNLTDEQAAAVPQAGGLAVTGLRGKRPIAPGERVLVNGAGGGVGTLAVQIATSAGAVVTGVDAEWKLDVVRQAGAVEALDYRLVDVLDGSRMFDRILDVACYRSVAEYRKALAPGGYCGLIGGSVPRILVAMAAGPATSVLLRTTVKVPFWHSNDPGDVAFLARLLAAGSVAPVIDSVRRLDEVSEAFRRFGAQQHTGKLVLTVSGPPSNPG